jgi:hypothetical protein
MPSRDRLPDMPGLLGSLIVDEIVVCHSWDVEFADYDRFYTVRQKHGSTLQLVNGTRARGVYRATVGSADAVLSVSFERSDTRARRTQSLRVEASALLQDFVCRYVFPKRDFPRASVAGRLLEHRDRNIWFQYPVDRLTLAGDSLRVDVTSSAVLPSGWRLEHYVRDEPGPDWIVHARAMPTDPAALWLRWDTRFGRILDVRRRKPLLLLRRSSLGQSLWYLAERRGGSPNLQLMGMGKLPRNQEMRITSTLEVAHVG